MIIRPLLGFENRREVIKNKATFAPYAQQLAEGQQQSSAKGPA
jgi:hypothetical protein